MHKNEDAKKRNMCGNWKLTENVWKLAGGFMENCCMKSKRNMKEGKGLDRTCVDMMENGEKIEGKWMDIMQK